MAKTVQEGLAEFSPSDTTYRLVDGVLGVIPGAPPLFADPDLAAVAQRLGATPAQLAEAQRIAREDDSIRDILWMSALVDTADKGYAIFTGVSSAVKLFWGSAPEPAPTPRGRAVGYQQQQSSHNMRRYKQLMATREQRRLRSQERQELRFLQQQIRAEVERRQQAGEPAPQRRRRGAGGPGRGRQGPPSFPGGPLGEGRRERRGFGAPPPWSQQPDDDFGDDFDDRFEDYDGDFSPGPAKQLSRGAAKKKPSPSAWERGLAALETDTQQRNDAIIKSLAIAYMAYRASSGSLSARARRFVSLPSGQALLVYFGAVEVGLPFADNALLAGGDMMRGLLGDGVEGQLSRLAGLAGGRSLGETAGMLQQLTGWMQTAIDTTAPYIDTIAEGARAYLPLGASAADKVAGLAANAADVMPCYRLLGARLAAEVAVARAMQPGG